MHILSCQDILKHISLFINYQHIWYTTIINKKISYNDDYWKYRAKNIYNFDKINNKKDYESYYKTFFELSSNENIIKYPIESFLIQTDHFNIIMNNKIYYYYIDHNSMIGNYFIHAELVKIVDAIKSDEFKNKHNFDQKIKYYDSLFIQHDEIYVKSDEINILNETTFRKCQIQFKFNNILIKKEKNKYTYTLKISKETSYIIF